MGFVRRLRAGAASTPRAAMLFCATAAVSLGMLAAVSPSEPAEAVFGDPATSKGQYVEVIDWVQWGTRNNEVVLQNPQSSKTVSAVRQLGSQTLRVDCTASGLRWEQSLGTGQYGSNTGQTLTPPLVAYAPGSWAGDSLDDLYNRGGKGYAVTPNRPRFPDDFRNPNSMVIGLGNPNPGLRDSAPVSVSEAQTNGARMSFDFSCSASLDGRAVPLEGIVFADAEASSGRNTANTDNNNGPEWVQATSSETNATWRLLEQERTCTQASTIASWPAADSLRLGVDGQECTYQGGNAWPYPNPNGHGPTAVAFLQNDAGRSTVSARVEIQGRGYSAIALGYVINTDFGDAPASYQEAGAILQPRWTGGEITRNTQTNLSTAPVARYQLPQRTLLGETVDAEQRHRHTDGADGDDVNGARDEDGLVGSSLARDGYTLPLAALSSTTAASYTVEGVACYGPQEGKAYVAGWIDWNGNGVFDPSERSTTAECAAGGPHRVDLTWSVPAGSAPSGPHTYLRLRIAEDRASAEAPTGISLRGEVEDHRLDVPARLLVDKTWIVNGQEHRHGEQPSGLDAVPTVSPALGEGPAWGEWQSGHRPGDQVTLGETTEIDASLAGCVVTASTLTGDGLPAAGVDLRRGTTTATVQLPQVSNRYLITNEVTCTQRLTLEKDVAYGERPPSDWKLSASGPAGARPGPDRAPTGTTVEVSPDVAYRLSEQGPSEYVATAEGWQCTDDRTGEDVASPGDAVTVLPGQDVTCTVTNTTARLTLLKAVESGDAAPQDWTLSADPEPSGDPLRTHVTAGSSDPDDAPGWEVRPDHPYRISERATDPDAEGSYDLDRVEVSTDEGRTWREVDAAEPITVPPGTHATYRFVNRKVPSLDLPLTGGLGRDAYVLAGLGVLLLGAGLGLVRSRRH